MKEFQEALAYLWGLKRLGTRPGPEITAALLRALGDPHRTFRSIHITGSKGKGSTAAMCAAALQEAGYRTGLYTSPHLLSFRERARVQGEMASPEDLVVGLRRVREAVEAVRQRGELHRDPTFFEVTTAWAFDLFARKKVEVAAVEVGLGGRLDATNVLSAPVTVVTTLELEHTELLGPTIEDVAREKAGIFHRGAWGVTGAATGPGLDELRKEAFRQGVPLWELGREVKLLSCKEQEGEGETLDVETPLGRFEGLSTPLIGAFQARNASLAVAALQLFERATGLRVSAENLRKGFAKTRWPGRLERVGERPPFYVDAAHTPESAREVVSALRALHPRHLPEESTVVFSCLADKHAKEMMEELGTLATQVVVFPLAAERALGVKGLTIAARSCFSKVAVVRGPQEGLALAKVSVGPQGILLATGGVYLAGAILSEVRGIPAEGPDLTDPVGRSLWSVSERSVVDAPPTRKPSRAGARAPRTAETERPHAARRGRA
ncbi:MAG: bifunctional folylpolyglutamate synthase/dihydrofolate synthase [Euryarchaeota archaeon]|nr:bifunctional folylpolyglutamate synthase/dihydrofolate synthase [Euryarchaeota archaeon]